MHSMQCQAWSHFTVGGPCNCGWLMYRQVPHATVVRQVLLSCRELQSTSCLTLRHTATATALSHLLCRARLGLVNFSRMLLCDQSHAEQNFAQLTKSSSSLLLHSRIRRSLSTSLSAVPVRGVEQVSTGIQPAMKTLM